MLSGPLDAGADAAAESEGTGLGELAAGAPPV